MQDFSPHDDAPIHPHTRPPHPDIMAETAAFLDRFIRLAAVPLSLFFGLTTLTISTCLLLNGMGLTHLDLGPHWHDFQSFWSAGIAATHGNGGKLYDFVWHSAHIKQVIGVDGQEFGWHYPPQFLLLLAPLALLPLPLAFLLWCFVPLVLFARLAYRLIPDWRAPVIAIGSPIFFANAGYAQNGVLSTVVIGFALLPFIDNKSPSALNTSLLAFKPHLGLVFPVAFASGGLWSTFWLAAFWLIVQISLTALVFGPHIWIDFLGSLAQTKLIVMNEIGAGEHHYASVYGSVRLLNGPASLAYLLQGLVAGLSLYGVWVVWRGGTSRNLKAALLVAAIPLTAPYLMHYDMIMAVLACLLLIRQVDIDRWPQHDRFILAGLWLGSVLNHGLQKDYAIPAALICNLLVYYLAFSMTRRERNRISHSAISTPE